MKVRTLPKVFVDASVVVSAVLSKAGASHALFELEKVGFVELIFTEEVIKEARLSIKKKYGGERLESFYLLLGEYKQNILHDPTVREINSFTGIISDDRDRHVLAGAKKYDVDVLVTLDRRHFFTKQVEDANVPFHIQLPGDFLSDLRELIHSQ